MKPNQKLGGMECCEVCYFSRESSDDDRVTCRRYPPTSVDGGNLRVKFPVPKKSMWCGEFQVDIKKHLAKKTEDEKNQVVSGERKA